VAAARSLRRYSLASLAAGVALASVLIAIAPGELRAEDPAVSDPVESHSHFDIVRANLRQAGADLVLDIRTAGDWSPSQFELANAPFLCVQLYRSDASPGSQVCIRGTRGSSRARAVLYGLRRDGTIASAKALAARVDRADRRSVRVRFTPPAAGLEAGRYGWQVVSASDRTKCPPESARTAACADRAPDRGTQTVLVRSVRLAGCRAEGPSYRLNGSRSRKVVSLTFDDGPSPYTASVLRILRRYGAHSTFFVLGNQIPGRQALLRRMLREGNDIANHSFNHANLAGGGHGAYGQMRHTTARIRSVTHYTPCLFRAPYGAAAGLPSIARPLGMLTIQWDVDPRDWARPGAGAIYARVTRAVRPGSIVVMHDGGGPRNQTVAALPGIIRTLQRRGYRLVTVTENLGLDATYR